MGNDKEIEQYVAGNFKEVTVDNGQDLVKVKRPGRTGPSVSKCRLYIGYIGKFFPTGSNCIKFASQSTIRDIHFERIDSRR